MERGGELIWNALGKTLFSNPLPSQVQRYKNNFRREPVTISVFCQLSLGKNRVLMGVAFTMLVAICGFSGCKTPPPGLPYGVTTVAPPATGMISQPAPYGAAGVGAVGMTAPQGASYPPSPVPGPAPSWQAAGQPQQPVQIPPATNPPQQLQQYGVPINNSLAQPAQNPNSQLNTQTQQYGAQLQNNVAQTQQNFNAQNQQYANQMQQNLQTQQQQLSGQLQQANGQVQQSLQPQQTTANGNWWPFGSTSQATPPATPARILPPTSRY